MYFIVRYSKDTRNTHIYTLSSAVASDPSRANRYIIIPERIRSSTIGLPAKVNARDLGNVRAPRPLRSIGIGSVRSDRQTGNGIAVQPRLNGAVGANVPLEALPGARRQRLGRGDALRRKVGERGVIGLAVVHEDRALAANAEVLVGSLGGIELGDEGDVVGSQSIGGFARWLLVYKSHSHYEGKELVVVSIITLAVLPR